LICSTVGAGSSSTMNDRPSKNALVVRECSACGGGVSTTIGPDEINNADEVDRVGVRSQEQRLGVHQLREHEDLVVVHARLVETLAERVRRGTRKPVEVHVQGVHEVEVVVHRLDGLASGHAVDEFERPEPAFELVRRRDWVAATAPRDQLPGEQPGGLLKACCCSGTSCSAQLGDPDWRTSGNALAA
jgi:hypothetical protein